MNKTARIVRHRVIGVPAEAMAQALAGAFFALLRWWVDQEAPASPADMDAIYHAIWLAPAKASP